MHSAPVPLRQPARRLSDVSEAVPEHVAQPSGHLTTEIGQLTTEIGQASSNQKNHLGDLQNSET